MQNPYGHGPYGYGGAFTGVEAPSRERFISRTYNTLLGAILLFTGIEVLLFKTGAADSIMGAIAQLPWMAVLGAYIVTSFIAAQVANTAKSMGAQIAALIAFVVAEALVFVPLLWIADYYAPGAIRSAATVTLIGFGALTGVAFFTKKDFSFLRGVIVWGGIIALTLVIAGLIFGFQLGTFFSVGMVALAGAAILYDTSKILRDFPEDRFVGAALRLFSSVATMFWYVLRIFIGSRR